MKNILQFKNKISLFREGIDYTFREDEGDMIYIVRSKELKEFFWGDVSEGSEYKVVVNEKGKVVSSEKIANSPHLVEEELWEGSSFGHFPKSSPASPSSQKDNENKSQKQGEETMDEKFFFGLRQEIAPGETTGKIEKTAYYRRKQGDEYVEDKIVIDDSSGETSEEDNSSRFQEITYEKDNSQGKSLSQKELDEKYKKVDDKKDLNKKQLEFIRANEKDIEKNKGVSSGVAIAVACGLAFVFAFGGIVWYRKKSARK